MASKTKSKKRIPPGSRNKSPISKKKTSKHTTALTDKRIAGVKITKTSGSLHLEFDDPREVVPHLLDLASDFAGKHFSTAVYADGADELGTEAAREIVSGCAESTCWNCTLSDLHLDSMLFQGCVFNGVESKGYSISRDQIPASQDTQLYTVVMAIQHAPRK